MAKREVEIKVKVDSKQAVKSTDKLDKGFQKVDESAEGAAESTGNLSSGLDSLGGGLGSAVAGAKSLGKAFLALAANPIGIVIGAIAVALLAVKTAFTSSEEGQNKYNKLMSVTGAILGNLMDLLADFGEMIIEAFENPQKSVEDLGDSIRKHFVTQLEGMLELIPKLGEAIGKLFTGDFAEAGEIAANAFAKATLGVEDFTGKVVEAQKATAAYLKEQEREAGLAARVADMRAKADKIERKLIVERSILESKIAQLRLKARQEDSVTAEERKAALIEAQELENTLLDKTTNFLILRRDAQVLENTFSRSNKENLDKEANAIAAVNNQVAVRANVARQLQRELNTINSQIRAKTSLEQKAEEAEKKKLAAIEIAKKESGLRTLANEQELKKLKAESGIEDDTKTPEQRALEIENLIAAFNEKFEVEQELQNIKFEKEKTSEDERNSIRLLQKQKHESDIKKIEEDRIEKIKKAEEDADKVKRDLRKADYDATVGGAQQILGDVSALLAEGSAEAKAISLAQATISGIQGVQAAYTSGSAVPIVGVALGPLAAALAAAVAAKNIQKIASTPTGSKKGGGSSVGGGSFSAPAIAPAINPETLFSTQTLEGNDSEVVGGDRGINQKVFVLESDITERQNNVLALESEAQIG